MQPSPLSKFRTGSSPQTEILFIPLAGTPTATYPPRWRPLVLLSVPTSLRILDVSYKWDCTIRGHLSGVFHLVCTSLLFMANCLLYDYTTFYPLFGSHSGCFHFGAVTNNAAIYIHVEIISQIYYSEGNCWVILSILTLGGTPKLLKRLRHFTFPPVPSSFCIS